MVSPVVGFYTDNWLAPKLSIQPKIWAPGQILYIEGIAPADLIMTVFAGGKEVYRFEFKKNHHHKACFPADLIDGKCVDIQFSEFFVDTAKRELALLLEDTNIFSEQDVFL